MIRFKCKAVPFAIWACEMCPSRDRAKRPDGLPGNFCTACEVKFLKCISAAKSKKDPLWMIRSRRAK